MTDFRALCTELVDIITAHANPDDYAVGYVAGVLTRARAALADEPAVPEGREPASVVGQPSDEAWDALVERAWDKYQTVGYQGERFMYDRDFGNALEFVRQGLARWGNPAPQPPAEGEVAKLVEWLKETAASLQAGNIQTPRLTRAALADEPAAGEPASVIGEPIDKRPTVMEIVELSSEIEAAGLGQVDFARAVLARWGNPTTH